MGIYFSLLKYYWWRLTKKAKKRGKYVEINDIRIYYEIHGNPNGIPLLFLHGGTAFIDSYAGQIPFFANSKKYKIICMDSRAHGKSTDSNKPLTYELLADDVTTFIDYLQLDKVNIIGWSDGGIIGLFLALNVPEKIDKLVLVGTNFHLEGILKEAREKIKNATEDNLMESITLTFYMHKNPNPNPKVFTEKIKQLWLTEPTMKVSELNSITHKTLILHGEDEEYIRLEHSKNLERALINSKLVIIPKATREGLIEKSKIYNNLIMAFLES